MYRCLQPVSYEQNPSNSNVFKDISLISRKEEENCLIDKLKKLPNITFNYVKPNTDFKVFESPKSSTSNLTHNANEFKKQTKVTIKKKGLSERPKNKIDPSNKVLTENNTEFLENQATQTKNNHGNTIPKKLGTAYKKYSESLKEKKQKKRANFIVKLPNISKKNLKKLKTANPVCETSKIFKMQHKVKQNTYKNAIKDKPKKSVKGDSKLTDLSSNNQIDITQASSTDLNNDNIPDYECFEKAIDNGLQEQVSSTPIVNKSIITGQDVLFNTAIIEFKTNGLDNN